MKIVFMGTPEYAATILEEISYQHEVVCAYTRADAVRGRGRKLVPSPVKQMAQKLEIPVHEPCTLKDAEVERELREFAPDIIVVAAYGMILPPVVLEIPKYGCINAHASILPRWRGAAPIERAILAGDEQVGVSIMRMEEGLDTGPYCVSRSMDIANLSCEEITRELAILGARAMLTALSQIEAGGVRWEKQDETHATYAHKIEKHELDISPDDTIEQARRKQQASSEAHPCKVCIAGKNVTLLDVERHHLVNIEIDSLEIEDTSQKIPEEIFKAPNKAGMVYFETNRLEISFLDGILEIKLLKPDGKREMTGAAFATGIQGIKRGNITWGAVDV